MSARSKLLAKLCVEPKPSALPGPSPRPAVTAVHAECFASDPPTSRRSSPGLLHADNRPRASLHVRPPPPSPPLAATAAARR